MAAHRPRPSAAEVSAVRRFNRFYTARARLLADAHLDSDYSLAEVRLLYELAHRDGPTAAELCADLDLDAGYVSRVVRDFGARGLVARTPSTEDRRQSHLALTPAGRRAFAPLDRQAASRVREMLADVAPAARAQLVGAMATVERNLRPARRVPGRLVLRSPVPGDLGWVVQRHGELYWNEYRYDQRFEALVATIVGEYVARHIPGRERCWIAELDGERAGSVFLVQQSRAVAKLRLLLVEPSARGHGIGGKLVRTCTEFARAAGYRAISLWTQSELTAARKLYVAEGYRLMGSKAHRDFGKRCVAETWKLQLRMNSSR